MEIPNSRRHIKHHHITPNKDDPITVVVHVKELTILETVSILICNIFIK